MTNPLLRTLTRRDTLSAQEIAIVDEFGANARQFPAKSDIVCMGDNPQHSCLILSGWSARYNLLGDGRRQITAVHLAGDFIDLHSLLLDHMDHSVLALTDCEIAFVRHERLRELSASHAHLTRMLWLVTIIDAAMYRQWLVAAGRLSATAQLAHFVCEMFVRSELVGLTQGHVFRLPLNQSELSDAMGLSLVHVNRTLQQLRRDKLIEWQGETVKILNWDRLCAVAEFDPTYLNLRSTPR